MQKHRVVLTLAQASEGNRVTTVVLVIQVIRMRGASTSRNTPSTDGRSALSSVYYLDGQHPIEFREIFPSVGVGCQQKGK
jgi:hypothetical protein